MLTQSSLHCGDTTATDGYFTTYYVANKILFDVLEAKLDIQVEDDVRKILQTLHTDIPVYDLPAINFYPVDLNELVLSENTETAFADLEHVLKHMIADEIGRAHV